MHSSQHKPPADVAQQLTTVNLSRSLRSTVCPACGGRKEGGKSLCVDCYAALPADRQHALYTQIDGGYEGALLRAFRLLNAKRFILPGDAPSDGWGREVSS